MNFIIIVCSPYSVFSILFYIHIHVFFFLNYFSFLGKRRFGYGLIFTRRHHCRNCGDSVCGVHSLHYITLQHLSYSNPVRVCNTCYKAYEEAHLNFQNFYLERTSFRIFNGIK